MPKLGTCALCLQPNQDLQSSHFLPAGVYKLTRDDTQSNPNPLLIDDDKVRQTSKQVQDHLLCHDCEERLNKNGENWFLANCWRHDGDFPLHDALKTATPITSQSLNLYKASSIAKIEVDALTYFAASMFWRASVHKWRECKQIHLGPYQEELRTYLLRQTPFPKHCQLVVSVPETITQFTHITLFPYGSSSRGSYRIYKLLIRGVGFSLLVGKLIPSQNILIDFVRGEENPICMSDNLEKALMQDVGRKMTSKPALLTWKPPPKKNR